MSLFSDEEICIGCKYAMFHDCCHKFCFCDENHEIDRDHVCGKCPYKINST